MSLTCEEIGHWGSGAKLGLQILGQEHDEATDDGDLTAYTKTGNKVHVVLQQRQHGARNVWKQRKNIVNFNIYKIMQKLRDLCSFS